MDLRLHLGVNSFSSGRRVSACDEVLGCKSSCPLFFNLPHLPEILDALRSEQML